MTINYIKKYLNNIKGQALTEYAVILLLVVAMAASLGTDHDLAVIVKNMFDTVSAAINGG